MPPIDNECIKKYGNNETMRAVSDWWKLGCGGFREQSHKVV